MGYQGKLIALIILKVYINKILYLLPFTWFFFMSIGTVVFQLWHFKVLVCENKTRESITSQIFGSRHFWQITNNVLNESKSAIPPLFNGLELLPSASDKAKLFVGKFSKNSNLDDSGISLPVFSSRTNLKLHNISVTTKMVRKAITNLDLSMSSGPDCIPMVVLKNCETKISYIPAELFNKFLKESCFPGCSLHLRMLAKGLQLKTTALLVFFL